MNFIYNTGVVSCVLALAAFVYLEYFASETIRLSFSRRFGFLGLIGNDRYLSLRTFAECERRLSGVSRVVVVCDHVEHPTSALGV